jgi:NADH-quinone oxidoreductase subunit A
MQCAVKDFRGKDWIIPRFLPSRALTLAYCVYKLRGVLISDYLGVVALLILGILMGIGALSAARFLGSRRAAPNKISPYECGIPSAGAENQRFSVLFYLVAVSFILFDIETVFLVPWAVTYRSFLQDGEGAYVFSAGLVFIVLLTVGLIYEWRKGLLDWNN